MPVSVQARQIPRSGWTPRFHLLTYQNPENSYPNGSGSRRRLPAFSYPAFSISPPLYLSLQRCRSCFFDVIIKADREGKIDVTNVTFWGLNDDVTWLTSFKGETSISFKSVPPNLAPLVREILQPLQHHIEVLSKELQKEFPGAKGYSAANLWRMRNFYLNYCDSPFLQISHHWCEKFFSLYNTTSPSTIHIRIFAISSIRKSICTIRIIQKKGWKHRQTAIKNFSTSLSKLT